MKANKQQAIYSLVNLTAGPTFIFPLMEVEANYNRQSRKIDEKKDTTGIPAKEDSNLAEDNRPDENKEHI